MKIRPDAVVKAIVAATFPDYRGRKFSIKPQDRPLSVASYWSEGSREYFAFYSRRVNSHELCLHHSDLYT